MLLSFFYGSSRSNEVKGNPQANYNPASHIHLFFGVVYMYVDPLAQISTAYLAIQSPAL